MTHTSPWESQLENYLHHLEQEERSEATRIQYRRDISRFLVWAKDLPPVKETVIRYKEQLQQQYRASSVNTKLAAINGYLAFLGRPDLKVRQLKIQRQAYCSQDRELTKAEYLRLVAAAKRTQDAQLSMLLQTICATGIRVSELPFITAEAVASGMAEIRLKGKNRIVLLPGKLCRILKDYLKRRNIRSGPVFVTRTGKPLDRWCVWKRMKALCASAEVDPRKVFPHNLRHLFARCFYASDKDLAKLADLLGHSDVNTTRIYIISTGAEHARRMDALGLVV